jgi:anaphase-promoting complex subunit 2
VYTIVENMAETSKNEGGSGNAQELLGDEEVEDRSGASVENQLRMEMTMYEVYDIKFFINFEL